MGRHPFLSIDGYRDSYQNFSNSSFAMDKIPKAKFMGVLAKYTFLVETAIPIFSVIGTYLLKRTFSKAVLACFCVMITLTFT